MTYQEGRLRLKPKDANNAFTESLDPSGCLCCRHTRYRAVEGEAAIDQKLAEPPWLESSGAKFVSYATTGPRRLRLCLTALAAPALLLNCTTTTKIRNYTLIEVPTLRTKS
eukprot:Gregarina_sp_Poly_1__120@NODE_1027_length_5308_cov_84_795459_g524_i2_p5_GENE_NODE_1027_length_5308_cov_84_795459_g524_i2NODE_1027_length_5308_cov_84_795459_g524_i2_p5_ORF_typecomplete_len111_score5_27_NODE_1027_length_5308_cov_84_795459_g524_i227123044